MFLFKMLSRIGVLQGVTTSNSSRTTQSSSSRDSFNGGGIRAIGLESSQGNVLVMGQVGLGSSSSQVWVRFGSGSGFGVSPKTCRFKKQN